MNSKTNTTGATAKSAAETVAALCDDRELVVVSNRQPYSHTTEDGVIAVDRPAGGLTAALDPVMQSAGRGTPTAVRSPRCPTQFRSETAAILSTEVDFFGRVSPSEVSPSGPPNVPRVVNGPI